jgi:rod shape-determining protein MreD
VNTSVELVATSRRQHLVTVIALGLVAFILQIAVAPHISIAGVVPNFLLVAVCVVALTNNPTRSTIYGFILGFAFDLFSQGPLGIMALILTVMGYALSTLNRGSFESNWLIELFVAAVAIFLAEVLHAVALAIIGYDANIAHSLLFRALPGALFETILVLIALSIAKLVPRKPEAKKRTALAGLDSKQAQKAQKAAKSKSPFAKKWTSERKIR